MLLRFQPQPDRRFRGDRRPGEEGRARQPRVGGPGRPRRRWHRRIPFAYEVTARRGASTQRSQMPSARFTRTARTSASTARTSRLAFSPPPSRRRAVGCPRSSEVRAMGKVGRSAVPLQQRRHGPAPRYGTFRPERVADHLRLPFPRRGVGGVATAIRRFQRSRRTRSSRYRPSGNPRGARLRRRACSATSVRREGGWHQRATRAAHPHGCPPALLTSAVHRSFVTST